MDHIFMTTDSAGFALAMDALKHGGKGSVARVLPQALSICLRISAKHMNTDSASNLQALFDDVVDGFILGEPRVAAEPAVMAYAQPPKARARSADEVVSY